MTKGEETATEKAGARIQARSQNEKAASEMLPGLNCMAESASIRFVGVSLYGRLP